MNDQLVRPDVHWIPSDNQGGNRPMTKIRILVLAIVALAAIFVTANVAGAGNGATNDPFQVHRYRVRLVMHGSAHPQDWPKSRPQRIRNVHRHSRLLPSRDVFACARFWTLFRAGGATTTITSCMSSLTRSVITDPNLAISGTIVVTDNGDGTFTWNAVSYYR